ncbi:MAG: ATP-binding cassette domain-containing protein [Candidatus Buchananbacteria bacterium]|nr:ATP-binding cassette domain-containing protein [Candidatus Buchananbacteria bacterium]
MKDVELDRQAASNWKEYLNDLKKTKDMLIWVWQELINAAGKKYAKKMFWIQVVGCAVTVTSPWTLSFVFDGLNPKNPQWNLVITGLILYALVVMFNQLITWFSFHNREYLFGENARQLDLRTTELFFEKSLGAHIDENNLLNEANVRKGYERVFNLEAMLLFEGVETLILLVLSFIAIWILDVFAGIMITIMLLAHLSWSLFLNLRVMQECLPIDKKWRALHRYRVERWDRVEKVKNNFKEKDELETIGEKFQNVILPDRKFWLWFIGQIIQRGFFDYMILIFLIGYGAWQVWQGNMAIGLLYPLYNWSRSMADNLWRVGHMEHQLNFVTPSILAMKEALTMPKGLVETENPERLAKHKPIKIDFENVSYTYPVQNSKDGLIAGAVLSDISFSIEPGIKVALIGTSGVGKTTIMRLLLRYMDPTFGSIKINGIDLRELDLGSWLQRIGYVPQQSQVLDGTIRYNLLYGLDESEKKMITDKELWCLMRLLQIDFGERLTHGLETRVGRNGIKLSGGQAQRLSIGAAVLKNPSFMIIDEATSSLDSTTEKLVQQGLEQVLTEERGALIVTHRLNTVRRICNKFILLDSNGDSCGRVAAMADSFEELAQISPKFCALAQDQGIAL